MSILMDEDIRRRTVKRKSTLVVEIRRGQATVVEASRAHDLSPSEIEPWVAEAQQIR
jgi:transposase-like protein